MNTNRCKTNLLVPRTISVAAGVLSVWLVYRIVVATSPLSVYTTVPVALLPIIESSYSAVATFSSARSPESSRAFDQQEFFLPYADFKARLRRGPDIRIYHRLPDSH